MLKVAWVLRGRILSQLLVDAGQVSRELLSLGSGRNQHSAWFRLNLLIGRISL